MGSGFEGANFRFAYLTTLSFLVTACGRPVASSRDSAAVACDISAAYALIVVAEAKGHPLVLTTQDQSLLTSVRGGTWWRMESKRPLSVFFSPAIPVKAPADVLLEKLEDRGNFNAVARCASVRQLLTTRQIAFGIETINVAAMPNKEELFKARIESISLPVLSAGGKQAVLAASSVSGPLAGGGQLILFELQRNSQWKVVAFSPLWVA